MKHITTSIILSLFISVAFTAAPTLAESVPSNTDTHSEYHGVLPDAYYRALGTCETGLPGTNEPNWNHSTRTYTGGLGFNRQTFKRWSNHSSAKGLTPRQQVKVADAIAFKSHIEPDGTKVWRVGPWGWGCLKLRKSIQRYICESRHPLVQRWKRNCQ
jgi:hypothetical protein